VTAATDFDTLEFLNVCYDYGRRRVLSRVSFSCGAGSIIGVLGPNGAGKSTLLTLAAGRARPSLGEVRYGRAGTSHHLEPALRGRIGWLGHDPGFYPELSARENLSFFARLHDLDQPTARVGEALERARLADRADEPVGGFSRGMRQRLGLERVLLHQPRLLLLDEPFTGLDLHSGALLLERLASLRVARTIVLLSTHDLDLVEPLLDRSVVLRGGRVHGAIASRASASAASAAGLQQAYAELIASDAPAPEASAVDIAPASSSPPPAVGSAPAASTSAEEDSIGAALSRFARVAVTIMKKDMMVEYRNRELFLTTLFFAVSCVLIFAFAFVRDGRPLTDAAAGILWIAAAFAGTLALGRTFDREQAHHTLTALLQAPVERAAIYAGKLLGLAVLLALVEAIVVPLVALFFQAPLFARPGWTLSILALGTTGFLAVGTLFSAMLVRTRSRDVLLPVLLYPMTVPVMIGGVRGTSALLQATPDEPAARAWAAMLLFFDVVFLTLALWAFDAVTSE